MNETQFDDVFLLSEGPTRIGKSYSSLYKYIVEGVKVGKGVRERVVRLESVTTPGGLGTSKKLWHEFQHELNRLAKIAEEHEQSDSNS